MASKNILLIVGRLARDPEVLDTKGGKQIVKGAVAYDRGYGERKKVVFLDFVGFREHLVSYIGKYSKKGDLVQVDGELDCEVWTPEGEDKKVYRWQLILNDFQNLTPKQKEGDSGGSGDSSGGGSKSENTNSDSADDEIPF